MGSTDANGRAEVGGLHDYRITEGVLDFLNHRVAVRCPLVVGEPYVVDDGHSLRAQNHLHGDFVHAVGRRKGVAAGVGQPDGLEHAFKFAVFNICAVEDREGNVESINDVLAEHRFLDRIKVEVAIDGAHVNLGYFLEQLGYVAVVRQGEEFAARVPMAVLGNVYWNDFVFFGVESIDGLVGRDYRYFMFGGASAEKHAYFCFHFMS